MQFRSAKQATDGGTSRRALDRFHTPRTSRKRRREPVLEMLEGRTLLSVDVTAFSVAAGTVTFTDSGDGNNLVLSEVQVPTGPGTSEICLAHNLQDIGTGNYANDRDVDPGSGVAYIVIGQGSSPLISVNFTGNNDTLTLDSSWTLTDKVSYTATGTGDKLESDIAGQPTWTITGHNAGNIGGTDKLTFSGVQMLQADADTSDTLIGENVPSTWTLGDGTHANTQSYNDGTSLLYFAGFTTIQGGNLDTTLNTFDVVGNDIGQITDNLTGGSGDNVFNISDGAQLTGNIDGGAGSNTLDLSAYSTALTLTLDAGATTGVGGTTDPITGRFDNITTLEANGAVSNALVGENATRTWKLDTAQTYGSGASTYVTFSGFNSLTGGTGNDTFDVKVNTTADLHGGLGTNSFIFTDGAILTGSIDGTGGTNTLDLSAYSTALTVTLDAGATSGVGGTTAGTPDPITGRFDNIGTLDANGAVSNALVGENATRTWKLDTAQTYGSGASTYVTFSGFNSLTGGTGNDTFNILHNTTANLNGGGGSNTFDFQTDGVFLSGQIDGGGNSGNTLKYSGYSTTAVNVNLGAATATGTLGIANIQTLQGGTNTTLVGPSTTNTWAVTGSNSGNLSYSIRTSPFNFSFTSVNNLTGGVSNDTFTLSTGAYVTGTINGGSGLNTLSLAGNDSAGTFHITSTNGGTVIVGGHSSTFVGMGSLTGSSGDDTFAFANGKGVTGNITGGGGGTHGDTLDYSGFTGYLGYSTSVRVNLGTGSATGVNGSVSGIRNVTGGSGNDILIGDTSANVLRDGNGNDIIVGGGGGDTIYGGTGYDIIITGDTSGAATVYGDGGKDLIIGGSYTNQTNLTALNSLMAEWGRTDVSLSTKIAHLSSSSGGRNGSYFLTSSTVHTDAAIAALYGGNGSGGSSGNNWFIAFSSDPITGPVKDKSGNDQITVF